jgi:hypothetical protein
MIFSDLASPAEAGFALGSGLWPARAQAPAGNRRQPRIRSEAMLFGIMRYDTLPDTAPRRYNLAAGSLKKKPGRKKKSDT